MTAQSDAVPEWRLHRTADEIKDRAKRTMVVGATIMGAAIVAAIVSYGSSVRDVVLPVAILAVAVGGALLLRGTRVWTTAYDRAAQVLTSHAA